MALTKAQAKKLRTLMTQRVTAAIEESWKGAQMPEEAERREHNLKVAEQRLDTYVKELTEK